MIRSMTAFARQAAEADWGSLTVEIKTVNHRYLDMSVRMPDSFREMELKIRELIGKYLGRGKVELNVKFAAGPALVAEYQLNVPLATQLVEFSEEIAKQLQSAAPVNAMDILKWPMVLRSKDADMGELKKTLLATVEGALKELVTMREKEGEKLQKFLIERLMLIGEQVEVIKPLIPKMIALQKQKLIDRCNEVGVKFDEERLEQELTFFAQRADVQEELDRLEAHISEVESNLKKGGVIGRRLDFLMQELHREANTLGSKSVAVTSTHTSVELKVLIEQMREQVQNVE